MTARKPFLRTAVAIALVLGLLTVPAIPAAADEVGGGWTQGITEWVSTWITSWQSSPQTNDDRGIWEEVGRSQDSLNLQPRAVPSGEGTGTDTRFSPPTIIPHTQEEQTCEGYPQQDPTGQC